MKVNVYVGIYSQNNSLSMKEQKGITREEAMIFLDNFNNNPNYQQQAFTKEDQNGTFPERYFVKYKRIA